MFSSAAKMSIEHDIVGLVYPEKIVYRMIPHHIDRSRIIDKIETRLCPETKQIYLTVPLKPEPPPEKEMAPKPPPSELK